MTNDEYTAATDRIRALTAKLTASERVGDGYGERKKALQTEIDSLQAEVSAHEAENP